MERFPHKRSECEMRFNFKSNHVMICKSFGFWHAKLLFIPMMCFVKTFNLHIWNLSVSTKCYPHMPSVQLICTESHSIFNFAFHHYSRFHKDSKQCKFIWTPWTLFWGVHTIMMVVTFYLVSLWLLRLFSL